MAKLPKKPRAGQKTIAALYRSINEIIDYLPSLTVKGDGRSISVSNTNQGSIISVKNKGNSDWKYEGDYRQFVFGDGIKAEYEQEMISGLEGTSKELLPQYVSLNIKGDNEYISAYYPTSSDGNISSAVQIRFIGTISGGGIDIDHKYCDNGCHSLMIAAPDDQVNGWNYIGVNPDWLAGNGMCSEGYFAIMSAILKAFSGTNQSTPFAIGSQSIQTMGTEIWVNPYWLAGYTSCSAGLYAVASAVWKYLNALPVDNNGNTLKKNGTDFYWGVDQTGGGGGGDDYVYKYDCGDTSIYFNSNNAAKYGEQGYGNFIGVNSNWLAGNGICQEGYDGVCSAIYKYLNALTVDNNGDTLKKGSNGFYWGVDQTGGGGSDGDHVFKYADDINHPGSLLFTDNEATTWTEGMEPNNYICVNASWLAGDTYCQAGAEAVQRATWKGLAGIPNNSTCCVLHINPTTSALYWGEDIGASQNFLISTGLASAAVVDPDTQSVLGTAIRLNDTYTSYLNAIGNKTGNTILSCQSDGTLVWATNTAGGGGGGGGGDDDTWYKYADGYGSINFYPTTSNKNGTTYIGVNVDWLAGNGVGCCCYQGPAAIGSAIIKLLTNPAFEGWKAEFSALLSGMGVQFGSHS